MPPALHCPIARLALIAALLMAFVPPLARLVASASPQVLSGLSELCTVSGLKWVELSDFTQARADASNGVLPADAHGGADCPYCLLPAAITVALLALAAWWFPYRRARAAPNHYRVPCFEGPPLRGLGSRGPPLTL